MIPNTAMPARNTTSLTSGFSIKKEKNSPKNTMGMSIREEKLTIGTIAERIFSGT